MTEPGKRWAVVTGASAGFGAALARALAAGHPGLHIDGLVLVARRKARLDELAEELRAGARPCAVRVLEVDLSDAAAGVRAIISGVSDLEVDLLVNCAGLSAGCADFDKVGPGALNAELNINVQSPLLLTRSILPGMIERGRGRVLNIGSIGSFLPAPFMATYGASKAWLYSWSVALCRELASTPVSVTCYCPGHLQTEFDNVAGSNERLLCRLPGVSEDDVEGVARHALSCTARGKRWATNGWLNWFMVMTAGMTPLWLLLAVTGLMQRLPGCRI